MGAPTTTTTRPGTTNTKKQGWEKTCDCGFLLRNYNQKEFVQMVQQHVKNQHNTTLDEKQVVAGAKSITF